MALTFTSGSTVSPGVNDLVIVATSTVTLPTATTAGVGRYYIVRNAGGSPITVTAGSPSTVSGITSLGPTSASHYISDGVGIWYSI
jgi:hypothetical protein